MCHDVRVSLPGKGRLGVPGQCLRRDSEGAGDVRSRKHQVSVASIQRRLVIQIEGSRSSAPIAQHRGSDPRKLGPL